MDTPSRPHVTRRRLLKSIGGGLALIPLMQLYGCSREDPEPLAESPESAEPADATPAETPPDKPTADLERLSEDDPMAKALGYRHATTDVDQATFPRHDPDQTCSNCALYQGGDDDSWGGCEIFPGKLVNANGWCNSWLSKA